MATAARGTRASRSREDAVLPELDWLMLAVAALCCLGLVMAVSVQGPKVGALLAMKSQGAKCLVGLVAFLAAATTPMRWMRRWAIPAFVVATAMCYAAALLFPAVNGASRWIRFGEIGFQPVEAARFTLVFYCAAVLAGGVAHAHGRRDGFLPVMGAAFVMASGLLLQPDLGNALLAVALAAAMALAGGVRLRSFLVVGIPALLAFLALGLRRGYVRDRLLGFLDVRPGSQVGQSLVATGSGGITGQGLGAGWMKMGFVPEAGNDFVFAIVGEELGLVGSLGVLALYVTIGVVGARLVLSMRDPFLRLVVFGLVFSLCVQAAINLLVVTGLAPAKGIDLPLLSSGGTNLVFSLAAVGVIGNAARVDRVESTRREAL